MLHATVLAVKLARAVDKDSQSCLHAVKSTPSWDVDVMSPREMPDFSVTLDWVQLV
jgi:hypothetical protein